MLAPTKPFEKKIRLYEILLLGVEAGGIWFSSETTTRHSKFVFDAMAGHHWPKGSEPAYFLPYSEIDYLSILAVPSGAEWPRPRRERIPIPSDHLVANLGFAPLPEIGMQLPRPPQPRKVHNPAKAGEGAAE